MISLSLSALRLRFAGFVAAFVVLFVGALVLMVCGGLLETGIRSAIAPQRLSAAPIVVTGDTVSPAGEVLSEPVRLDAQALETVATTPGVARAIPVIGVPVSLGTTSIDGHNWASSVLAPYELSAGGPPQRDDEVVVSEELDLAVGDVVPAVAAGASRPLTVVGTVSTTVDAAPVVFFTDEQAAALVDRPQYIDAIGVLPETTATTATVAQTLESNLAAPAVVLVGAGRGAAEFPQAAAAGGILVTLAAVFGGLAMMLTIVIVGSTLSLSIRQRSRELALLRAIGTTPTQVRRMIVGETIAIAIPAAVLAWLLSPTIGAWTLLQFVGGGMVPDGMLYSQGFIPVAAASVAASFTAVLAALVAAHGPARTRPVEALADAEIRKRWLSPGRIVLAALCIGGAIALSVITATVLHGPLASATGGPAVLLWAAGIGILAPGLGRGVVAIAGLLLDRGRGGYLAVRNTAKRPIEFGAAVVPVMLVIGVAGSFVLMQLNQASAVAQQRSESVTASDSLSTAAGVSLDEIAALRLEPGIHSVTPAVSSDLFRETTDEDGEIDAEEVPVIGVSAPDLAGTFPAIVVDGNLTSLTGHTIAVPVSQGRPVGEVLELRMGGGEVEQLTIVATLESRQGYEVSLLPADTLLAHTGSGLVHDLFVDGEPTAVAAFLAQHPDATTSDPQGESQENPGTWINYLLVGLLVSYAVISLANTSIVAISGRRREFALLRLIGLSRAAVIRMVAVEAAITALVGAVLGLAIMVLVIVPFNIGLLGSPLLGLATAGVVFGSVVLTAGVLTLATMVSIARLTTRQLPAEVLASRARRWGSRADNKLGT